MFDSGEGPSVLIGGNEAAAVLGMIQVLYEKLRIGLDRVDTSISKESGY